MNFEFFKLANVEKNSVVTEDTYSLVVNGDNVQKTKNSLIISKFYKDFTNKYEKWASQQQDTQKKDIETFVKTLITTDGIPYKGYIESTAEGTALFEVAGDNINSKQHLEVFYESVVSGQTVNNLKVCDFYNSITISSNIYSIINGQLLHSDESNLLSTKSVSVNKNLDNILIDGHSIKLYNSSTGISLSHNNDECLTVEGNGGIPIEIKNVEDPTLNKSAANKIYVDNKITQLNGRIDNLTIGGDNAEAEEIVTFITEPVQISSSYTADTSVTLSGTNIKLISFEWAFNINANAAVFRWRTNNLSMTDTNGDGTSISLHAYGTNNYDTQYNSIIFKIVYSRKATLNIPELTDLRTPFSPGQIIEEYNIRQNYLEGEKVIYDGHYYICVRDADRLVDVPGQSSAWELLTVSARTNIQNALAGTLKADGSVAMIGNLNLNGTNKIINLAAPTSGTDAANKNYVDSIRPVSDTFKSALLELLQHVAYTDANGQHYLDVLEDALYNIYSLEVVFTSSSPIYINTDIDSLKDYLIVTAIYGDGKVVTVDPQYYEISGELQSGSCELTVSYDGKDSTFSVTVIGISTISAVFNQGNTTIFDNQSLEDLKDLLTVNCTYDDSTSGTLTNYSLSGVLSSGTSVITVDAYGVQDDFNVIVTAFVIPSGYTRYGYIQKKTMTEQTVAVGNFIWLNNQPDMNVLSLEVTLQAVLVENNAVEKTGVLGARVSGSNGIPYYAIYFSESDTYGAYVSAPARNIYVRGVYYDITKKATVKVINPPSSPYYVQVDDGEPKAIKWETSPVIPYGLVLFNNIPHGSTGNFAINRHAKIGDIILRKNDGECVGYYTPCVYSGKIGMYDQITQTFYTASTASAVTISNSGCLYAVGNWS